MDDVCITTNIRVGAAPLKAAIHYCIKIDTLDQLLSFAVYASDEGLSVLDRSMLGVYPKYLVIPNKSTLQDGDLVRVYSSTKYPELYQPINSIKWRKAFYVTDGCDEV